MGYDKDRAITAAASAHDAATLLAGQPFDPEEFRRVQVHIFNSTLELSGATAVAEVFDAPAVPSNPTPQPAPVAVAAVAPAPVAPVQTGALGDAGGGVSFKFGKFAGRTIADAAAQEPGYLIWIADKGGMANNSFITGKVQEFLAANPQVRQAGEAAQAARAA